MVIQRIQNLALFIAFILMTIFAFVPFIEFSSPEILSETTGNIGDSLSVLSPYSMSWGIFGINIFISIFLLLTIFKFKNLKFQKKLSIISLFLIVCYMVSVAVLSTLVANTHNLEWSLLWSVILPVLSIVFVAIAIHGIKKDIKILSSYDRIR